MNKPFLKKSPIKIPANLRRISFFGIMTEVNGVVCVAVCIIFVLMNDLSIESIRWNQCHNLTIKHAFFKFAYF